MPDVVGTGTSGRISSSQPRAPYLTGLACFHERRWEEARKHFLEAARLDPSDEEARALAEQAALNAQTRIDEPTDATRDFTRAQLLRPPALALREPRDLAPLPPAPRRGVVALAVRGTYSAIAAAIAEALIKLVYRLRDRNATFAYESWDRRSTWRGKLELAGMREDLCTNRLQSTYDPGLVGAQQPGQLRPPWTERFRTATGAWTTDDPMEGAAGSEIQRSGSPLAERRNRVHDPLPNPREVSRWLLQPRRNEKRKEVACLNLLALAWIQAQFHDWVSHRPTPHDGFHTVRLEPDDPLRRRYRIDALRVPRSATNPLGRAERLTHLSECTHWWDASHIYGSDQETQDRLRAGEDGQALPDGKLRLLERDLLPLHPLTGFDDSGFTRNWWVGLSLVHILFVKHHNHICDVLKRAHGDWKSDQLFHTARLVNAAILAKIHSVEWTPAVLPNPKVVEGMGANWWGLLQTQFRRFGERRLASALEPMHPVLGGIVGGRRDNHGKPYGLTEEFAEVYRLHAAIPDSIVLRPQGALPMAEVPMDATRAAGAREMVTRHGVAALLNSLGHQHMHAFTHNNYPAFMSGMSVEQQAVFDMGTVDILRARERGVPPYNEFRRMLGLNPIRRYEDLGCDAEALAALRRLYGEGPDGVESMDLLAGTSCELSRPRNFGFGETMFAVFIQMASRRLQADPFFTDKMNARYYSEEGMALIESATFKGVLLQHYPDLARSGLGGVHNGFEPWGTTARSHPEEHPLAAIERY